jgi:hypothetical protein
MVVASLKFSIRKGRRVAEAAERGHGAGDDATDQRMTAAG